jgi:hypothetical protein
MERLVDVPEPVAVPEVATSKESSISDKGAAAILNHARSL